MTIVGLLSDNAGPPQQTERRPGRQAQMRRLPTPARELEAAVRGPAPVRAMHVHTCACMRVRCLCVLSSSRLSSRNTLGLAFPVVCTCNRQSTKNKLLHLQERRQDTVFLGTFGRENICLTASLCSLQTPKLVRFIQFFTENTSGSRDNGPRLLYGKVL